MSFLRTNARIDQLGFVRGPAMLYMAPLTQAPPEDIGDVIRLDGTPVSEQQTLTITGTPTGGTFRINFKGVTSGAIAYDASAADVQAALELMSTIGAGNVTCSGGALPGTPVVITFANNLADQALPLAVVVDSALTGGTTPAAAIAQTVAGEGMFDPLGSWFILGATRDGIHTTYSNDEETFTMDQKTSIIGTAPTIHTWGVNTNLLEVNLDNLALVCDMGPVTLNTNPDVPEKRMGMGSPANYTPHRLAVIHRRPVGQGNLLRMHFFRIANRGSAEVDLSYSSTGPNQSIAARWTGLVDDNVANEYESIGYVLDQVAA
jgi:hypothetical protein